MQPVELDIVGLSEARVDRERMATWPQRRGPSCRAEVKTSKVQLHDLIYGYYNHHTFYYLSPLVYPLLYPRRYMPSMQTIGMASSISYLVPFLHSLHVSFSPLTGPGLLHAPLSGRVYVALRDTAVIVLIAITSSVLLMTKYGPLLRDTSPPSLDRGIRHHIITQRTCFPCKGKFLSP